MHKSSREHIEALTAKMVRDVVATGAETERDFIRLGYTAQEIAATKETLPLKMKEAGLIAA